MYGTLRQSDFLPVGEDQEWEHWQRGYDSLNSSDSEYEGDRGNVFVDSDAESEYDEEEFGCNELFADDNGDPIMYNAADFPE